MLNDASGFRRIYLATGYTDLRRGMEGLASIIKFNFQLDPYQKDILFLFCGRRTDRIKGLVWEGDGFLLLYKRLELGAFNWPRTKEENRQRKEQEIRLVKELVNKAEDYRIAKEIREYIQAMIDSGNEDITPEWIEWALKKADWYDPSIETEDEYLGKRQHEKSAEEKEKSLQDSIRKSWYW